jgi:urease alpha subunit
VTVTRTRSVRRDSLAAGRVTMPVEVDPVTGAVSVAGRALAAEPVQHVPLSRRYLHA